MEGGNRTEFEFKNKTMLRGDHPLMTYAKYTHTDFGKKNLMTFAQHNELTPRTVSHHRFSSRFGVCISPPPKSS